MRLASLAPEDQGLSEADLPPVLSAADEARYRRIFALQEHHEWRAAERQITGLGDRLLLGEVLAQRYRTPGYPASYGQLSRWLARYADEPDARAIYALALERRPEGAAEPRKPRPIPAHQGEGEGRKRAAAGKPKAVPLTADEARGQWQEGLADWRRGRLAAAGRHFRELAKRPGPSVSTKSTAAFWAARVAQRSHQPEHAAYWLGIAAEEPRTFYGLIARRLLGVDTDFNFDTDPFTELDAASLLGSAAGRRALALLVIGERRRAAAELRLLAERSEPDFVESIEALADRANLPSLSLRLAAVLADGDGRPHDYALYPVPRWQPHGGFSVDRALLFALMRQESLFLPRVKSEAGALGLMQLMPATARSMAERTGERLDGKRPAADAQVALADPELNLTLAQEYVETLLDDPRIRGNLLLFACAYNGGPATAARWQAADPAYRRDPLLFIESVPSAEARSFTKRVLANYWIYRQRLGQPTADLDALAAGSWPIYTALDGFPEQDGRHAENR